MTQVSNANLLFEVFYQLRAFGVEFAPISGVDNLIANERAALIIKHDIHGLDLCNLVAFAEREAALGVRGTYFFMPAGHPVTEKCFSFTAQVEAMKAVAAQGHELGLHIDPYFQIHQKQRPLGDCLRGILDAFAAFDITLRVGNMHGNSRHKHPDRNGFGTMFDLVEEVARQPDFPILSDVPEESAAIIRANRIRVQDYGFTHWGDMPVWSAKHGFVLTNFMTDNQLGKKGTMELLLRQQTTGSYSLAKTQPPGSRNMAASRKEIAAPLGVARSGEMRKHLSFDAAAPAKMAPIVVGGLPLLFLVHPEHYC